MAKLRPKCPPEDIWISTHQSKWICSKLLPPGGKTMRNIQVANSVESTAAIATNQRHQTLRVCVPLTHLCHKPWRDAQTLCGRSCIRHQSIDANTHSLQQYRSTYFVPCVRSPSNYNTTNFKWKMDEHQFGRNYSSLWKFWPPKGLNFDSNTQESHDSLHHPALIRYGKWIRKSSY